MTDFRNNGFNASTPVATEGFGEKHVLNDNGGLSGFHHFEEEEEGSGRAKLIGGALVVALLMGGAGLYMFSGSSTSANMPVKAPAQTVASNAPAPVQTAP